MVKTTVRYERRVFEEARELWEGEGSVFDNKSNFFRFSAEYALNELKQGYQPTDEFERKLDELEGVEAAEEAVMAASDPYFEAFDYATSMKRILEEDEVDQEERIEAALERTYDFIRSEFSGTYAAEDLI